MTDHHRMLLAMLMRQMEDLARDIEWIEADIRRRLAGHQDMVERLSEIPGFGEITVWTVIAELGLDMEVFGTPQRAASWAGLCPGNRTSAGKRRHGDTRHSSSFATAPVIGTWGGPLRPAQRRAH